MKLMLWLGVVAIGIPILASCSKESGSNASSSAKDHFDTQWASEEHWLVSTVVADLQGMAGLSGITEPTDTCEVTKEDHHFKVGSVELEMDPSCWDIASYKRLLESWKIPAAESGASDSKLVHDLLTPTATVIQKANLELN